MKMGFVDEDGDGENDVIATCQADIEDAIAKQQQDLDEYGEEDAEIDE